MEFGNLNLNGSLKEGKKEKRKGGRKDLPSEDINEKKDGSP